MKRFLIKLTTLAVLLTLILGILCAGSAQAANGRIKVGDEHHMSGRAGGLGYDLYHFATYPYTSDSSIARVTTAKEEDGFVHIWVKGLKPGTVTVKATVGSYGTMYFDYVPHYIEYTIEVYCDHDDMEQTAIRYATTCENGYVKYQCADCGKTTTETLWASHDYDSGKLTTKPTPTEDGVTTYTCRECGKTKTESFSKSHAVHIVQQPTDASAALGSKVKTTVKAEGDGLTYKWYTWRESKGSSKGFAKKASSIKNATYSVKMASSLHGMQAYCVITDKYGNSVQTDTVTLRASDAIKITQQPKDASAKYGSKVTTAVKAKSQVGQKLSYKWYIWRDGEGGFEKKVSGIKSATYSTTMKTSLHGMQGYCVITDPYGAQVQTDTVTLSMKGVVKLLQQPKNASAMVGSKAKATVKATGDGLKYKWYLWKDGVNGFEKKVSGIKSATYSTKMTDALDGMQAYCVITDKYGFSVQTDTITFTAPDAITILEQPQNVTMEIGDKEKATVKAKGEGLKYKWYVWKSGENGFDKKASSITSASYTVKMTSALHGMKAYCVITNKYGKSKQTDTITFKASDGIKITQQPQDTTAVNGEKALITVKATGEGLKYRWYYKDYGMSDFVASNSTKATYTIKMAEKFDDRQLYCRITDRHGIVTKTDTITLTFNDKPIVITQQPVDSDWVGIGEVVSASVQAEGAGLTYKWYYKNRDASGFSGSTQKTNTFSMKMDLAKSHREVYCKITDKYGNSIKSNTVTLKGPGVIEYKELYGARLLDSGEMWYFSYPNEIYAGSEHGYLFPQAEGHGLTYRWKITFNPNGSLKLVSDRFGTYIYESPNYYNTRGVVQLTITDSSGTTFTKNFDVW